MSVVVRKGHIVIVRLSLTLIRNNQMLFVREPGTLHLFDPGGERVEGRDDQEVLVEKMKEDLGVDFLRPLDRWTTYAAPALGKPEGTMVENHCFFPHRDQPPLDLRQAKKEWVWIPAPPSPASLGLLQKVQSEGLLPEPR